ncbi:DUF2470 domain-containing protein [Streptomyces spongiicola]|uniref:DUF2470 domain-containing protein n=1 Tax=Streptomyces spongiicola TaxID=1690221 RepID=A0A2S1YYJ6_9ACTN|nr:DUF2470 domain-containing protein [Streptomyces spongiicola]AWK09169.1 DUF2470 domain-containing protein [Streptomyces spongiicola]GBP99374.1 DUF2470 domain-containing protein [Streptomyces spongiicola]
MTDDDVCAGEQASPAERVRTVLAAAESFTAITDGHTCDLVGGGPHGVGEDGTPLLRLPADSRLAGEVALAPRGTLPAVLKFTDIAPVAVRDRVRSRVTIAGWLARAAPEGEESGIATFRTVTAHVALETPAGPVTVGLDELALARPDVLARQEAAMLTHLVDDHADAVALLTRLVDPRLLQGVARVWPLSMDRRGITLRLEYPTSHEDVLLRFPAPVDEPGQAGHRVRALLVAARACRRGSRLPSRP